MMNSLAIQQHPAVDVNMSNLTSASGEASASSGSIYQQSFATPNPTTMKKKRNLPGNPDPDAEVIALSPKSLMATNRFVCEICNKGFQRDQNLQLHRRGHNLPWKLKQRTNKEVRKRVYICPEPSCVHHDPSRALGDLTGIKKHFSRKHGEKKWKCHKCSKRYAVQSDWKAHSKTCGTREYRCDCGTLFSRRDSFITHRAFCDALAEESARAIPENPITNPLVSSKASTSTSHGPSTNINLQTQFPHLLNTPEQNSHSNNINAPEFQGLTLKREQQEQHQFLRPEVPPWLALVGAGPGPPTQTPIPHLHLPSPVFSTRIENEFSQSQDPMPNNNHSLLPAFHPTPPHMSATALLQKAAQMGASMSRPSSSSMFRLHQGHMTGNATASSSATTGFGMGQSSREEMESSLVHGLTTFGNKADVLLDHTPPTSASLLQNMMTSLSSGTGFDGSFDEAFGGLLGLKREENGGENPAKTRHRKQEGGSGGGNDGLTRDFLGLRAFSHRDILNMAGLDPCLNSSSNEQTPNQKSWQG
ncbi:protein indeterminate-domain-containing protein [Cinnamomum micranthum f. kanehirae]|uniref:Protein indeterminate-domain-containing protein n=1 Tax=Cinnamomum micranthum f. kanehirae TaxID=337451 RepID=A0A3S4N7H5_9MAGN|nr:protein indeterminate-domain-containing protein [Cinnamomum micranthum f. kanehirae]